MTVSELVRRLVENHGDLPRSLLHAYLERHEVGVNIEETVLDDRGFCHSGTVARDAKGLTHFLLTIPEPGGEVPEKRHLRLFPGPQGRGEPVITLGEERVCVLAGALEIFGADVTAPSVVRPGMEATSYRCEAREGRVELFQDRHGLRARESWTTMLFRRHDVAPEDFARRLADPAVWNELKVELEESYGRFFFLFGVSGIFN